MSEFDAPSEPAFLSTANGAECWTWAGARLSAEGLLDATQRYADLSWDERRDRLADEESAWLAAQWDKPAAGNRFELRFATGPGSARVRTALLFRAFAANADDALSQARYRLRRATDPRGALPPHVKAEAIGSENDLWNWLQLPHRMGSCIELRKHLSSGRVLRGGATIGHAVCHGFFARGAAWDAWWRKFAELEIPTVLCVGFDCYDSADPQFRRELQRRTMELESLALPAVPAPGNPYPVPAEPAAQAALPGYRRALARSAGRGFRIRLSLAAEQPLPPNLVESLVRTVSSVDGAVKPVQVLDKELDAAVGEHGVLGAPWLPATYQQGLPVALDGMDRLLHSLADVPEAASILSLPVHWPGMPPVFGDDEEDLREMMQTITVTAADGEPLLDPEFLAELEEALNEQDEVELSVELKDRPPAPGEQGATPFELEIVVALTAVMAPFAQAFAAVLADKFRKHRPATIKIDIGGGKGVEVTAERAADVRELESAIEGLLVLARKGESG